MISKLSRGKAVVVWIISLALLVTVRLQAKDTQPPIVALFNNALYAVSAEDGTSRKLVEAPANQYLFTERYGSVSPDGKQVVYAIGSEPDDAGIQYITVFLLNLETGESTAFQPSGGVFDNPPRAGYYFELAYPTWSADGNRLYYVRSAYDLAAEGKTDQIQLAYWDVKTEKHQLVARLDPQYYVFELKTFKGGVIASRWDKVGNILTVVYGDDNRLLGENDLGNIYPVEYKGRDYYPITASSGEITNLIDIETGKDELIGRGFFTAARSTLSGDQSMHIITQYGSDNVSYVYGVDYRDNVGNMTNSNYVLSPDGQSVAFTEYITDWGNLPAIQVMSIDGTVRTLPFKAGGLLWGPSERVAFYAPG